MSKLERDLREAFAGESQANRKYHAFAKRAEHEGYIQVAKLFRAAAEVEAIHAQNHLRVMGAIKTTKENLQSVLDGEVCEFKKMYPPMIDDAKVAGNRWARKSFHYANEAEKIHADLFKKALDNLGVNKDVDYYVCKACAFTVEDEPPDKCPVCGSRKEVFWKVV
jgi:rubrerythrin